LEGKVIYFWITLIAAAIVYLVIALNFKAFPVGFVLVREAEVMIIERLGQYHRRLDPGVHFIWPFFERPRQLKIRFHRVDPKTQRVLIYTSYVNRIDVRERIFDFPQQHAISKDNVGLTIDGLLYYQVFDAKKAVYAVADIIEAIARLSETTLRAVIGGMVLDETLSERETINRKIQESLDQATSQWGVRITRVELQDIKPPAELTVAMNLQMEAERQKRATVLKAEGDKQAAQLTAEGEKQAMVITAEGEKQAAIFRAEGEASARYRIAQAEAEAIRKLMEVVGSSEACTQYLTAIKYIDAFKHIISEKGDKVVMMPYEASAVLSSIEMIRSIYERNKPQSS